VNKAILIGNLAGDVESRTTSNGISTCTFRVATQRRAVNKDGAREADFHTIVCWRGLAENCARYLRKGSKVAIEGQIQNRSYDAQDGTKRYVTEIVADNVEFLSKKDEDRGGKYADELERVRRSDGERNTATGAASVSQTATQVGFEEVDDDELPF
jgi:single-strand DNA-binding protein